MRGRNRDTRNPGHGMPDRERKGLFVSCTESTTTNPIPATVFLWWGGLIPGVGTFTLSCHRQNAKKRVSSTFSTP